MYSPLISQLLELTATEFYWAIKSIIFTSIVMSIGWSIIAKIDASHRAASHRFLIFNVMIIVSAVLYVFLNFIRVVDVADQHYSLTMYMMVAVQAASIIALIIAMSGKRVIYKQDTHLLWWMLVPVVVGAYESCLVYKEVDLVYAFTIPYDIAVISIGMMSLRHIVIFKLAKEDELLIKTIGHNKILQSVPFIVLIMGVGYRIMSQAIDLLTKGTPHIPMSDFTQLIATDSPGFIWGLSFTLIAMNILLIIHVMQDHMLRVLRLSKIDMLTGVFNRAALTDKILSDITHLKRVDVPHSLVLFDIDHFKKINDTHGHLAGDTALLFVANLVKSTIREVDTVGRYGGEEFIIILPNTTTGQALLVMDKIRMVLMTNPLVLSTSPIKITASFGITSLLKTDSILTVIERADLAMYEAKNNGRNRCVVI